jgi:hypothetical protein
MHVTQRKVDMTYRPFKKLAHGFDTTNRRKRTLINERIRIFARAVKAEGNERTELFKEAASLLNRIKEIQ